MNQKNIFIGIIIILVIGMVSYFAFIKNQTLTPQARQIVFASQDECEQTTGKPCGFQMCDYIPQEKTFEEVCGKDFKEGWVANPIARINDPTPSNDQSVDSNQTPSTSSTQTNTSGEWKIFSNDRLAFQFSYPAEWSSLDQLDNPDGIDFWSEEGKTATRIMSVNTGVDLSVIGITYCGAEPQDSRCESLKTENGNFVTVDWDVSGKANAIFSSQDGTSGVSFTLHKVDSESKDIFKKILSTFEFIK